MTGQLKTIAKIDSTIIAAALESASPVTVDGRKAVSKFKQFLLGNPLTATGLQFAIESLQDLRDNHAEVGIENLLGTLKGIMPAQKRAVAIAYEKMQLQKSQGASIFTASPACEAAIAELYDLNASKIIKAIATDDVLAPFATNPVVSQLIQYAKAAQADAIRTDKVMPIVAREGDAVSTSLVPILNIAYAGENRVIYLDKRIYVVGKRGKLTPVQSLSDLSLSEEAIRILDVLQYLRPTDQPNILTLRDDLAADAAKDMEIRSFSIDLLAAYDGFVLLNGVAMSADKAKALLNVQRPQIVAAALLNPNSKVVMQVINEVLDTLVNYRDALLSNVYAKKISFNDFAFYVMKFDNSYTLLITKAGTVINLKAYDNIMALLADEYIVGSVEAHNAISVAYAADIEQAQSKANIKLSLINKLSDERQRYEALIEQIKAEEEDLQAMSDANPEKVKALKDIREKAEANLAQVNEEMDKLQSK